MTGRYERNIFVVCLFAGMLMLLFVLQFICIWIYSKISNIRHTLVGNKIVDHSGVVGALPVRAAPTASLFLTQHLASMNWAKTTTRQKQETFKFWDLVHLVLEIWWYSLWDMLCISLCMNLMILTFIYGTTNEIYVKGVIYHFAHALVIIGWSNNVLRKS